MVAPRGDRKLHMNDFNPKEKSKGFGDTIFKLVFVLRLNLLMDWMMNGFDCGCETRRESLNKLFPYKFKKKIWH